MAKHKTKPKSPEPIAPPPAVRSADEQALLAAVIAQPDEDTPRLMYADWLQEYGDPLRAEFIRTQIEATRLPQQDPHTKALRARVVDLAERLGKQWSEGNQTVFVRGFQAALYFYDLNEFCENAESLFSRHPISVVYANEAFGGIAEAEVASSSHHFARLTGLGNHSRGWNGDRVAKVLTNPHLANLRMLDLNNGGYNGTEGARGVAAAAHLTKLIVLDLTGNEIGNEGLEALADAKHLASLRALRLGIDVGDGTNNITEPGIVALAHSQSFASLTQLDLNNNEVGATGLEHILSASWVDNLTELNLAATCLSEAGLMALARSRRLPNLRRLDVAGNEATEAVALAFLESNLFPNLIDLHLFSHHSLEEQPTEATQVALRERFGLNVIGKNSHEPNALCIEDKIRWRMQTLTYTPPEPTEDCEAV